MLHLSTENGLPNIVLARYLYEMLPPDSRPPDAEVSPDGAARLAARIAKLRIQATRFRVRYHQFPQYLEKFLMEIFQPFQS